MEETNFEERRAYLMERIAWNQKNIEGLQRDRRRLPFLFLLLLVAVPGGIYYGPVGVIITVVGTLVTIATGYYLTWGHGTEYAQKIDDVNRELEALAVEERTEKMRRLAQSP